VGSAEKKATQPRGEENVAGKVWREPTPRLAAREDLMKTSRNSKVEEGYAELLPTKRSTKKSAGEVVAKASKEKK